MDLLTWVDVPLALCGTFVLALCARGWFLRPRPSRGLAFRLVLGVGLLSTAAVDVGLWGWDCYRRPVAAETNAQEREEKYTRRFRPGDSAPDFSLPSLEDERPVRLSDFRHRKPVLLIFSSFS